MEKSAKKPITAKRLIIRCLWAIPVAVLVALLGFVVAFMSGCSTSNNNEEPISLYTRPDPYVGGYWGFDAEALSDSSEEPVLYCWAPNQERLEQLVRNNQVGQSGNPGFSDGETCNKGAVTPEGYELYQG